MHAKLYFSELLQYDLRKIGLSKMTLKSMKVITNGDRSYIHHSLPLQNVVSNREILTVTASLRRTGGDHQDVLELHG